MPCCSNIFCPRIALVIERTIKMVGLGCAPADAMPQVKAAADYVTKAKGGRGVIREVVEKILQEASK